MREPRQVYFIAAYKLEHQFEWLFRALWNPDDLFIVHVDLGAPEPYARAVEAITAGRGNVRHLPRRRLSWGGWSLTQMMIDAVRLACAQPVPWQTFINLSGQDFPLRSPDEIRAALARAPGRNCLTLSAVRDEPFHVRRRLHWWCLESGGRLRRLPIPNLRAVLAPIRWHGDYWAILSRDFCEWLATAERTEAYARALRHTKIPDEFFLQNLLMDSPFAATHDRDPRRFMIYPRGASGPRVLTSADLGRIAASSAFFGRKFDAGVDEAVLHRLADRIGADRPRSTMLSAAE